MMRKMPLLLWSLLFLCCVQTTLSAQARREELTKELIEVKPFKEHLVSHDFKQGEEIILTFETTTGRKFSHIEIMEPNGSRMNMVARRQSLIPAKRIRVYEPGQYTFKFRNRRLRKAAFNLRIEKNNRMMSKDTMELDDIIFTSRIDSVFDVVIDTVALPDVVAYDFALAPGKNIGASQDTCIFEALLEEEPNQYAVYWVGVGDEALAKYEALRTTPPPHWSLRGVNDPLIAYGLRLTKDLPIALNALGNGVLFRFRNPDAAHKPLQKSDDPIPFYGFISMENASKFGKLKLCFRNLNVSSGVKIYLRVAKFKLETRRTPKIIVRERTQEIYIKSQYETVDTRSEE